MNNNQLFTQPFINKNELKELIKEAIREKEREDNPPDHPSDKGEYSFSQLATGGALLGICIGTEIGLLQIHPEPLDLFELAILLLFITWLIILAALILYKHDIPETKVAE